jgi:two-component system, NarL family, sensor histidine kinase DesK
MTVTPTGQPEFQEVTRSWGSGWRRYFFPGFWLVYLGQTVEGVSKYSSGAGAVVGYVLVALFAACYLAALPMGWVNGGRLFWSLYGVAIALTVAECFFARDDALVFCVYLAVLTVASRRKGAFVIVLGLVAAVAVTPRFIPSWGGKIDWNGALTVFLVSFAMFGFFMIVRSNIELSAARAEVARLAAENERGRIARDLHDLLGHSLTTITVKAALARRLAERGDATRSLTEITEVEQLSRRTLADVRAAVAGHNDVTLAGEIATAREVLRAAAIEAELPGSVDIVDPALSELFGWVVREAVTNVVRHSRAQHCVVNLGPRWIEIADDGRGGIGGAGNGLTGLRDRVGAAAGTLLCTGTIRGWRVRAEVPSSPVAASIEPADANVTL